MKKRKGKNMTKAMANMAKATVTQEKLHCKKYFFIVYSIKLLVLRTSNEELLIFGHNGH